MGGWWKSARILPRNWSFNVYHSGCARKGRNCHCNVKGLQTFSDGRQRFVGSNLANCQRCRHRKDNYENGIESARTSECDFEHLHQCREYTVCYVVTRWQLRRMGFAKMFARECVVCIDTVFEYRVPPRRVAADYNRHRSTNYVLGCHRLVANSNCEWIGQRSSE